MLTIVAEPPCQPKTWNPANGAVLTQLLNSRFVGNSYLGTIPGLLVIRPQSYT